MNRRLALKNLTLGLGYAIAAPTIFNMLSSCTADLETWKPLYFTEEQKYMVTNLVAIILPMSEIPGGLDVNVPQFIDLMYNDVEKESNKKFFQKGAKEFQSMFEEKFDKNILNGTNIEFQELFETYFKLSEKETKQVLRRQRIKEKAVSSENKPLYYMYKFLFAIRYYAVFGYVTSEKIGEEVLSYDPVPGVYKGCVPLEEIGNAWSLK
ncbi:gluconate 2-dehydrogenase subunit 3 family protein [Lutibacter citreus]|uniref:gluconate 2-dehydrogenase subunit 3 family protein n=1 Tax=Lutibacter citreus TaxID=2138210 RepID=UPI000DBE65E4|nr:gluconate 2-dehydrogenase subunit 3 family protein [Lutibacter citreus]